jgi:hypothetical protein
MFDTYSILLVVALALSLVSLKYRNILFALGGILGWIGLWAYHKDNPPAGIIEGTFIHEVLMYAYIAMAIATFIMWLRNRNRGYTGYPLSRGEQDEQERRIISNRPTRGLMDLSTSEYRSVMRAKINSHVKRRRR